MARLAVDSSKMKSIKGNYDDIKDWVMDPNGYFLIRVNREQDRIEAGWCKKANEIILTVYGTRASDVYFTLIKEGCISRLDHAAYLGKELAKAEISLKNNLNYVQDGELGVTIGGKKK